MRVISGQARGLKLVSPMGLQTRPTLDRVKEAVFSMLMQYTNDAVVLDLFAGSGAMGIEALSRGAAKAVFVDNLTDAIECVEKNLISSKMMDKSLVVKSDALSYLRRCSDKFDLIFLDPPYEKGLYKSTLESIRDYDLLLNNGLIVVEWDREFGFSDDLCGFEIYKEKRYGRVGITLLKRGLTE